VLHVSISMILILSAVMKVQIVSISFLIAINSLQWNTNAKEKRLPLDAANLAEQLRSLVTIEQMVSKDVLIKMISAKI